MVEGGRRRRRDERKRRAAGIIVLTSLRGGGQRVAPPEPAASGRIGASASELIAYRIDNFFSTRTYAKFALLAGVTIALVGVGGGALWLAKGRHDASLLGSLWLAWRFVTDGGEYDEETGPRVVGLVLVLAGMLFFALLVGLIGDSIESRLDDLKQGRARVLESGHTLILGWSDKAASLILEIAKSKASEGGGVIVLLDDAHEKTWYDEVLAEEVPLIVSDFF